MYTHTLIFPEIYALLNGRMLGGLSQLMIHAEQIYIFLICVEHKLKKTDVRKTRLASLVAFWFSCGNKAGGLSVSSILFLMYLCANKRKNSIDFEKEEGKKKKVQKTKIVCYFRLQEKCTKKGRGRISQEIINDFSCVVLSQIIFFSAAVFPLN